MWPPFNHLKLDVKMLWIVTTSICKKEIANNPTQTNLGEQLHTPPNSRPLNGMIVTRYIAYFLRSNGCIFLIWETIEDVSELIRKTKDHYNYHTDTHAHARDIPWGLMDVILNLRD